VTIGEPVFTPPNDDEMVGWVLVLVDAAKDYPLPAGRRLYANT